MYFNNLQTNNRPVSLSFGSLKPLKKVGESVIKEFRNEFGYLQSSSIIEGKILLHTGNPKYRTLLRKLDQKVTTLQNEIYDDSFSKLNDCGSIKSLITKTKNIMKRKGKANCWEDAVIVYEKLQKRGLNPQNFQMILDTKRFIRNHVSTVVGLKKGAKIENPKTWGNKAIIVDAWQGIVMKADDAIRFFEKSLKANSKALSTTFENANPGIYTKKG